MGEVNYIFIDPRDSDRLSQQEANAGIDGAALLAQQPKDHSQDVKKDTSADKTKARVEAFMKDSGKISELLTEGKFGKVRAFLDRHPVLTFALGGAVLATTGAIGVATAAAVVGGGAVGVGLLAVPFLLPITAPVGLIIGTCLLGTFGVILAPAAGILAGVGLGFVAWGSGFLGVRMMVDPLDKRQSKESKFQESLANAGIGQKDRELAVQHLKRAKFLNMKDLNENIKQRTKLAFQIKNNNSLSDESKKELLAKLTNKQMNTEVLDQEHQLAEKWSDLKKDDPLVKSLAGLLPQSEVDAIMQTPVDSESYTKRCEIAFDALKNSPYVRAVQERYLIPELGNFKAREVEQLVQIANVGKNEYIRLAMLNLSHDQLRAITAAAA